jgi:peptidoglycan/xylan/chitin deacetylase (PgdA/CDA1 family)
LPRRSVLLTFDDGYRSFLQYALPVLKELGFSATLFIYTDYVGAGGNAFTWADLKKLQQEGFDVQAHSKSHGDMVRAASESASEYNRRLEAELTQPRALFQKYLGFAPDILAYPYTDARMTRSCAGPRRTATRRRLRCGAREVPLSSTRCASIAVKSIRR